MVLIDWFPLIVWVIVTAAVFTTRRKIVAAAGTVAGEPFSRSVLVAVGYLLFSTNNRRAVFFLLLIPWVWWMALTARQGPPTLVADVSKLVEKATDLVPRDRIEEARQELEEARHGKDIARIWADQRLLERKAQAVLVQTKGMEGKEVVELAKRIQQGEKKLWANKIQYLREFSYWRRAYKAGEVSDEEKDERTKEIMDAVDQLNAGHEKFLEEQRVLVEQKHKPSPKEARRNSWFAWWFWFVLAIAWSIGAPIYALLSPREEIAAFVQRWQEARTRRQATRPPAPAQAGGAAPVIVQDWLSRFLDAVGIFLEVFFHYRR